jgi:D-lyxose ketol-isomerase
MKRSQINAAIRATSDAFAAGGWALPPDPRWDVTDLGLGDFEKTGLVLINLAEEPEYCEKLMYSKRDQVTPMHTHRRKKEDIVCRWGQLTLELWNGRPDEANRGNDIVLNRNGKPFTARSGQPFTIEAGERVTLVPGVYHAFWAASDSGCVIGEVSTANDDANDNVFVDPNIGRFPEIEEDEAATVRLVSEVTK